jgi:hypothetical protein
METESLPPQGFRHAVDLLLKNGARTVSPDGEQLARELVALAADMRASAGWAPWVIDRFERVLQRPAPAVLAELGRGETRKTQRRDLFLVYVPEDRLPVAAPLAVELVKRGVSVAFSEYEVAHAAELEPALERGLHAHRAGAVVVTPAFSSRGMHEPKRERLTVVGESPSPPRQAEDLILWLSKVHT